MQVHQICNTSLSTVNEIWNLNKLIKPRGHICNTLQGVLQRFSSQAKFWLDMTSGLHTRAFILSKGLVYLYRVQVSSVESRKRQWFSVILQTNLNKTPFGLMFPENVFPWSKFKVCKRDIFFWWNMTFVNNTYISVWSLTFHKHQRNTVWEYILQMKQKVKSKQRETRFHLSRMLCRRTPITLTES